MTSTRRAFVIMPFGEKKGPDGTAIDFDAVYQALFAPAITAAGLMPHRADADRRGGSIHLDMFQDLLLAEFVVADLTLDNPNVLVRNRRPARIARWRRGPYLCASRPAAL
jgi:hypothetical protein